MDEKTKQSKTTRQKSSERKPKAALAGKSFKDGAIYLFKRADYVKLTFRLQ